jgi:hypothetical protein
MKRRLQDDPQWSARTAYYTEVNQITVRDVALAPPLSSVERALQRHKVHNCPPLPVFCQDLVLQQQHTTISSGLPFLLINDGFADRILVWNRGKLTKVSYRVSRVRYCCVVRRKRSLQEIDDSINTRILRNVVCYCSSNVSIEIALSHCVRLCLSLTSTPMNFR